MFRVSIFDLQNKLYKLFFLEGGGASHELYKLFFSRVGGQVTSSTNSFLCEREIPPVKIYRDSYRSLRYNEVFVIPFTGEHPSDVSPRTRTGSYRITIFFVFQRENGQIVAAALHKYAFDANQHSWFLQEKYSYISTDRNRLPTGQSRPDRH